MNFWKDFTDEKKAGISRAIEVAESGTSGEIRVHLEDRCRINVFDRAVNIFKTLNMNKTELRNGILLYTAVGDRKFVIIGDAGINAKVPVGMWDQIKEKVLVFFREDKVTEGLTEGIRLAGDVLKEHFPHQDDDVNELSNEISYGDTDTGDE
jgi:uncharacterized membrane protein